MTTALDIVSGLRFDVMGVALTTKKQGKFLINLIRREQRIIGPLPCPSYIRDGSGIVYEVRRMGRLFSRNNNQDVCHVLKRQEGV